MARIACAMAIGSAAAAWAAGCALPLGGLGDVGDDGGTGVPGADSGAADSTVTPESGDDATPPDGVAPGSDGAPPEGSVVEGGGPDAAGGPGVLANVGSVANATGLATQTHLVYATHAAQWWLFWIDSTHAQTIQTSHSADFVTWTPGASLPLGFAHAGQGGNFSVAYADLGGADVVHLTAGAYGAQGPNDRHHLHVRAVITGATIAFGAITDLSDVNDPKLSDPDGPATYVDPGGGVWDATGWANFQGTGNEVVWLATNADQGTGWTSGFGMQQNVATATGTIHSRAFGAYGNGGVAALWETAEQPAPQNVAWAQYTPPWTLPAMAFTGAAQDPNDWGVGTMTDGHMHVVRRQASGNFDHGRYDGAAWTALAAPPADPLGAVTGSGVVVVIDTTRCAVLTIAADAASSVRIIAWNGAAWGAWSTLEGSPASRRWLSGWSGASNAAVVWTQPGSAGNVIAGRTVTF